MHPILAHPSRVAAYVAIWVAFGVLLAAAPALQGGFTWETSLAFAVPLSVAYGFLCLSAYYAARGLPLMPADLPRTLLTAFAAAFLTCAVWLLLARGWLTVVAAVTGGLPDVPGAFRHGAPTLFVFGILMYLLAAAVSVLGTTFEAARDAERRGLELQVLARESELRALRAQLDPHFLFNSLQSISALTTADPAAARRMCLLLADFLRDTLALGSRPRITLAQELSLARRFLAIEQVRYGDRLRVEIEDGGAGRYLVPPLLLQPLVENAVTHGIAHLLAGGAVTITAAAGAALTIVVENPADPARPAGRGTGLGLANVRERLRSSYGPLNARVDSSDDGATFRVRVELPLESRIPNR
jgi:hypothetical protein